MTGNQTMVHHVQLWHLYSCDGTCTSGDLCWRPSSLVAFHICYLVDRASTYEILDFMTRFHCTIWCIHLVWRPYFTVYCMWRWPLMTYIYYAYSWPLYCYVSDTAMYTSCLQSCVAIYHCIILMSGWFFPPGSSLLHLWDYYNVFQPSCIPMTSHIRGHFL